MEYCVITSASEQLSNHIGDFTSKWDQKTRSRAQCWTRRGGVTCQRHRFYCVASTEKKIFVFDVCAYLIQVSELHTHFRRITTSTHIPKINTLRCIGLYPTLCLLQIQNSGKVNRNVVKPMRFW